MNDWTPQEDALLQQHYGKTPVKEIVAQGLIVGRTAYGINMHARKLGIKSGRKHSLYTVNRDFWKEPSLVSAYWAGFLAADGTLVKDKHKPNTYRLSLAISVRDEAHLEQFRRDIQFTGKIGRVSIVGGIEGMTEPSLISYMHICQATHFKDDLAKLGIIQNKTKRIPPPALANDLLQLAYLKGYIDGDGTLTIANNVRFHVGVISSCYAILEWIKDLVDRLFPISYREDERANVNGTEKACWQYNVNGHRGLRVVQILSRIPTPELARKWRAPRVWELIEQSKLDCPRIWTEPLPIESDLAALLATSPAVIPQISAA